MGGRLKPSWRNILLALEPAVGPQRELTDGNGRRGCARGEVLRAMRKAGLIEFGYDKHNGLAGYLITDAGRQALKEQTT